MQRRTVVPGQTGNRGGPWLCLGARRHLVRGCDRVGHGIDEGRLERAGCRQMIDRLPVVEARHLDGVFHRRAVAVEAEGSVVRARDRNDPVIDLRRKRPVDYSFTTFAAWGPRAPSTMSNSTS